MPKYVAFLRGMNLGKRRVTNTELERAFKALKFENVSTFIASGNVIFDSRAGEGPLRTKLETHLEETFGYPVPTFLRTTSHLADVATVRPFAPARHKSAKTFMVGFIPEPLTVAQQNVVLALAGPKDEFHVEGREIYWLIQTTQSQSEVFRVPFDKRVGTASTWRNINTVQRLVARYP
ncbi:MAG: DUF1697 domain-containing protein [Actinomycetota bacterium]|nr:DUF1697 domain-containing protein [Actinomycetota bacterium]